jgi:hypothetical protein
MLNHKWMMRLAAFILLGIAALVFAAPILGWNNVLYVNGVAIPGGLALALLIGAEFVSD